MKFVALIILLTSSAQALPEVFEISTWAEPFDIQYPTAITVSADGTVYVSVDRNSTLGTAKNRGKVIAARDTDGDGQADAFTNFVPDVDSPRGGHFVRDTLYLVHPPFLSAFRDTDGDFVADEQKVLLKNFGFGLPHSRGADHTTNACRMGIDGWLYLAVGDYGMAETEGTDGRKVSYRGGALARVRPDGTGLEIYSEGLRHICDVAITPTLDLFSRGNTNDDKGWDVRLHQFTEGSDHGYPRLYQNFPDECVRPMLELGRGSAAGVLYVDEPGLPKMMLTCDWTNGKVNEVALRRDGAGFRAVEMPWLEVPSPTDIDVDGESNLYLSDWRGGQYDYAGDRVKVGLIQKITRKDLKVEPFPDLRKLEPTKLVPHLFHASAVRRLEAQREILARGVTMKSALLAGYRRKAGLEGKVAWLYTLRQLTGEEFAEFSMTDPRLREFQLRALAELATVSKSELEANLKEKDPRIVLQAIIGLRRLGAGGKGSSLKILKAARTTRDERVHHTAVHALVKIQDIDVLLDECDGPLAQQALMRIHHPKVVSGLIYRLQNSANKKPFLKMLARLCHQEGEWNQKSWWGTGPDDRGPYFTLRKWAETPRVIQALESAFLTLGKETQIEALEIFGKNRLDVSRMDLGEQDPLLLALLSPVPDAGQIKVLHAAARDRTLPWSQQMRAFRALERAPGTEALQQQIEILGEWLRLGQRGEDVQRQLSDFITQTRHAQYRGHIRSYAKQLDAQGSRVAWQVLLTISQNLLVKSYERDSCRNMAKDNPEEEGFFLALVDLGIDGYDSQIDHAIQSSSDSRVVEAARRAREILCLPKIQNDGHAADKTIDK